MLSLASSRGKPRPPVELACGSQSMRRVGRPSRAIAAARLMAVVVLPTPPFWLTTAMTLDEVGADEGLVSAWEVIIGVWRRVSGRWDSWQRGWAVQKCGKAVENWLNACFPRENEGALE